MKLYLYAAVAGILGTALLGGYLYITSLQAEVESLKSLNMAYELQIQTQNDTINQMQTQYQRQAQLTTELTAKNQEIENERDRYLEIFQRHDLTRLASARPGLIETRANKATKDVFDSIEQDSVVLSVDDTQ